MPVTLYRADSRTPDDIETQYHGFGGRQELSIDQARNLAVHFFRGVDQQNQPIPLDLPEDSAHGIAEAHANSLKSGRGGKLELQDVIRAAKAEKSATTVHISTDFTTDCGGYASGSDSKNNPNVTYRMDIPEESFYLFKPDRHGRLEQVAGPVDSFSAQDVGHVRPLLIMNAARPEDATLVALASNGDEVTFLTKIPAEWITQYRTQIREPEQPVRFSEWQQMPHVQAQGQARAPQADAPPLVQAVAQPAPIQAHPQAVVAPPQIGPAVAAVVEPVPVHPIQQNVPAPQPQGPQQNAQAALHGAHPYASPEHPLNRLHGQAMQGLEKLGPANPHNASAEKQAESSAALVHAAVRRNMHDIDHVLHQHQGDRLFVVQGALDDASNTRTFVQQGDFKPPMPAQEAQQLLQGGGQQLEQNAQQAHKV